MVLVEVGLAQGQPAAAFGREESRWEGTIRDVSQGGLRLTLDDGREAAARLVVTAIAVALGVGMLLAALACLNALNAQNGRAKWLDSGEQGTSSPSGSKSASDPLWWILTADQFGNQTIKGGCTKRHVADADCPTSELTQFKSNIGKAFGLPDVLFGTVPVDALQSEQNILKQKEKIMKSK